MQYADLTYQANGIFIQCIRSLIPLQSGINPMKKRITEDEKELIEIIRNCDFCTLAMSDKEGKPYAVHMNFGIKGRTIFFHSDPKGLKINILQQNPEVCLVFSNGHELRWQNAGVACSYSMKYRSVIIRGKVEFINDFAEKQAALETIMLQYTTNAHRFSKPAIENICAFFVKAERMEGRIYGY